MSRAGARRQWQRLDARMLLVHPVRELIRFLPVRDRPRSSPVSAAGGSDLRWQLLGIGDPDRAGPAALPDHELPDHRRPDRAAARAAQPARALDAAGPGPHRRPHRLRRSTGVLGLVTVRVGTGRRRRRGGPARPRRHSRSTAPRRLRARAAARGRRPPVDAGRGRSRAGDRVVLALDPAWVRFAPLTTSGLVIAAGVLGAASQLHQHPRPLGPARDGPIVDGTSGLSWWTIVLGRCRGARGRLSLLSVGGYLVTNWGFELRHAGGRRLAPDAAACSPPGRPASTTTGSPASASASRWACALGRRRPASPRSSPAWTAGSRAARCWCRRPRATWSTAGRPRRARHRRPGGRPADGARPRRPAPPLDPCPRTGGRRPAGGASCWSPSPGRRPGWSPVAALGLPVGLLLAVDRARGLGHALVDGHLVSRSGSLDRHRHALDTGHVIGWTFRSTWFQRRAGLTTLAATTAGGKQKVSVLDVAEDEATRLAADAVPGLVEQFTLCLADRTPTTGRGRRR